jgi:hypothetical protein
VDAALRFLALLPRRAADARTYTMAVSVCAKARDVHAALQVRCGGLHSHLQALGIDKSSMLQMLMPHTKGRISNSSRVLS